MDVLITTSSMVLIHKNTVQATYLHINSLGLSDIPCCRDRGSCWKCTRRWSSDRLLHSPSPPDWPWGDSAAPGPEHKQKTTCSLRMWGLSRRLSQHEFNQTLNELWKLDRLWKCSKYWYSFMVHLIKEGRAQSFCIISQYLIELNKRREKTKTNFELYFYLHPEKRDACQQIYSRLEVLKSFRTAGRKIILKVHTNRKKIIMQQQAT